MLIITLSLFSDDGRVSFTEYMTVFHIPQDIAEKYFNLYDTDKDGYLTHNVIGSFIHLVDQNSKYNV